MWPALNGKSYVRDARFKPTNRGELFDLSQAPFKEILIPAESGSPEVRAARKRLQAVLEQHPTAAGAKADATRRAARQLNRAARARP